MAERKLATAPTFAAAGPAAPPSPRPNVIIVEEYPSDGRQLEQLLREAGCDAKWVGGLGEAARLHNHTEADVWIVSDGSASTADDWSKFTNNGSNGAAVIVISSLGTVEGAVEAMRRGAAHYAYKPISPEEITIAVRKAAENRWLRRENVKLRDELTERTGFGSLVIRDKRMREICTLAQTVAQTRATVLLLGESGCGKSMLARAIHQHSPRKNGPFIEVNCGALPENLIESELFGHARGAFTGALRDRAGRFEAAAGGTIFLDEIGNASASLQMRLLRVLQDKVIERIGEQRTRPVDARVILATNHDLTKAVRDGHFREDLYYRIHVVTIELPPLRERPIDIPELAKHFLEKGNVSMGRNVESISADALAALLNYPWPGNIRELENAIERSIAVGRGKTIEAADLPREIVNFNSGNITNHARRLEDQTPSQNMDQIPLGPLEQMLLECERRFLQRALAAAGGNRTKAAKILGLHRATLYQRLHRVNLDPRNPLPNAEA